MEENKLFEAVEYAAKAHRHQYRKGTKIPYIVHPLNVMQTLTRYGADDNTCLAGLFHDLIEDTKITKEDIRESFGQEVADLVESVSEPLLPNGKKGSWTERKTHTIHFLASCSSEKTIMISLCDKIDNSNSLLLDYQVMGDDLWQRFSASYEQTAWYYLELDKVFKAHAEKHQGSIASLYKIFHTSVLNLFVKK